MLDEKIRDRLKYQLLALKDEVKPSGRSRSGGCHWRIGEALNNIHAALIETLNNTDKQFVQTVIAPIKVDKSGPYSLEAQDAFRLCEQLLSLFISEEKEEKRPKKLSIHAKKIISKPSVLLSNKVFIIHGHDQTNTLRLRTLLKEKFQLNPVILTEQPGKGRALIEKFEQEAEGTSFAFVLITPDDLIKVDDKEYAQARPNVVFELGWFYGRLGRARVCILFKEGTNIHSDLDGVIRIQFRDSVEEKLGSIEKELKAAGLFKK